MHRTWRTETGQESLFVNIHSHQGLPTPCPAGAANAREAMPSAVHSDGRRREALQIDTRTDDRAFCQLVREVDEDAIVDVSAVFGKCVIDEHNDLEHGPRITGDREQAEAQINRLVTEQLGLVAR